MHFKRKSYFFYILLLITCVESYAQQFRFRHYEVEDGLPSNTIRSLIQDSHGFMWFGTENGLSRFDGHTFKNYRTIQSDSTSLGNNYIYSLYEDSFHTFWIGTNEGIYIYNFEFESFSYFSVKTNNGIAITSHITAIHEDHEQNIWFATLTQGIFRYDRQQGKLFQYELSCSNHEVQNANMALALYVDHRNNVWTAPQRGSGELNLYDRDADKFTIYPFSINGLNTNDAGIYAIYEDSNLDFWIGTWSHGICKLDRNTKTARPFLIPGTPNGASHIHEITEYQPGILLIGSDDGLSILNTQTYESELLTASEFKNSTLSDKFIYPIYIDKEGGLWIGTYYGGVNYASPYRGTIIGYSHSDYENSVGGNIISCFAEDSSGNIWIGTDDGGLSYFDPQKKTFKNYLPDKTRNSISYHNIHALCIENDKLWIGTYSGGLNILDLQTNHFKHYKSDPSDPFSLYGNSVYSIYKENENIWIGTMDGICLYNREDDNFLRIKEVGTTVIDIIRDPDGYIWFATLGAGLFRYDNEHQSWQQFLHDPSDPASIPNNQINTLCIAEDNRLWLGTDDGLAVYDRRNNTFPKIKLDINHAIIYYIKNINKELWITTNNGLISYMISDSTSRHFYKSDGLQSDQFNLKSGLLSSSGELYLGTTNGFNIIKPEEISENLHVPPIFITNIQVSNKDLEIESQGILTQSVLFQKQIELSYKENVFSIEYIVLSYNAPSRNQYKYMLEGFDKEWNDAGNQQKATYTNLPAGKYIFRVTGSNNDGIWNEQGTLLTIIIHPPFWQTPFAYLLYILAVIGISGLIIFRIRRLGEKKHQEHMRQLQVEKDKELHEAKINFFTLVAHEIRTPVSLIIGPLEKIMDNLHDFPQLIQDSLKIINRNSQRLLLLVNQLLDFRKAEEKAFIINFSSQRVYDLLNNLYIRFKPLAEQKDITLSLNMNDREDMIAVVDPEALTKMISNLLTNAIKYAQSNIEIHCLSDKKHLIIMVADDGAGIQPGEQKNIFLPFYQAAKSQKPGTGIGLSLVKLLVDAHNGMVEVESAPDQQTTFTISLPLYQEISEETTQNRLSLNNDIVADEKNTKDQDKSTQTNHKATLLIAEDSTDMRRFLSDSLRPFYHIIEAKNGREGMEKLKSHPVDIIVSDIMMPQMNGIEFTQVIKENIEYNHIPIILLTAKTDKESKVEGMKTGADAYVEKPFSLKLLQAQIDNLLKSRMNLRKKFSEMPFTPLNSVAGNKADKQFLDKMNKLIEKNISNPDFSVDNLAEELLISRSGLFAKMKSLTGMTPNELIQLIRLKKAAGLLSENELRINEICYTVGFNNPSYFSKCFQKQFGVLPKDFVNQKRNSNS